MQKGCGGCDVLQYRAQIMRKPVGLLAICLFSLRQGDPSPPDIDPWQGPLPPFMGHDTVNPFSLSLDPFDTPGFLSAHFVLKELKH